MSEFQDHISKQKEENAFLTQNIQGDKLAQDFNLLHQMDQERFDGQSLKKQKQSLADYMNMYRDAPARILQEAKGKTLLLAKEGSLVRKADPISRISNRKDRNQYKSENVTLEQEFSQYTEPAEKQYRKEKKRLDSAVSAFDAMINEYVQKTFQKHPDLLSGEENKEELLKELLNAFIPEREFTFTPPSDDQKKMARKFLRSFRDDPKAMLKKMQNSMQGERLPKNAQDPRYVQNNYRKIVFDMKKKLTLSKVFPKVMKEDEFAADLYETREMGKAAEGMQEMIAAVDQLMEQRALENNALMPQQDQQDDNALREFQKYRAAYQKVRKTERILMNRYRGLVNLAIVRQGKLYDPEKINSKYKNSQNLISGQKTVTDGLGTVKEKLTIGEKTVDVSSKESLVYPEIMKELQSAIRAASYTRFKTDALSGVKKEAGLPQSFLAKTKEKEAAKLAILESRIKDLTDIANAIKEKKINTLNNRCSVLYQQEFALPAEDLQRKQGVEALKKEMEEEKKWEESSLKDVAQQDRPGEFEVTDGMKRRVDLDVEQHNVDLRRAIVTEETLDQVMTEKRREWERNDKVEMTKIRFLISKGRDVSNLLKDFYEKKKDREATFRRQFHNPNNQDGYARTIEQNLRDQIAARKNELLYADKNAEWNALSPQQKLSFYKTFVGIGDEPQDDSIAETIDEQKLSRLCPAVAADLRTLNERRELARQNRLEIKRREEEKQRRIEEEKRRQKLAAIEKFRPKMNEFLKENTELQENVLKELEDAKSAQGCLYRADLLKLQKLYSRIDEFYNNNSVLMDENGLAEVEKLRSDVESRLQETKSTLTTQIDQFKNEIQKQFEDLENRVMKTGTLEEAREILDEIEKKKATLDSVWTDQNLSRQAYFYDKTYQEIVRQKKDILVSFQFQNYESDLEGFARENQSFAKNQQEVNHFPEVLTDELVRGIRTADFVLRLGAFKTQHANDEDKQYFGKEEKLKKADEILDQMKEKELDTLDAMLFDGDKLISFTEFVDKFGKYKLEARKDQYREQMRLYYQDIGSTYLLLASTEKDAKKAKKTEKKRAELSERLERMGEGYFGVRVEAEKELLVTLNTAVIEDANEQVRKQAEQIRKQVEEQKKKEEEEMRLQARTAFSEESLDGTARNGVAEMQMVYQRTLSQVKSFNYLFNGKHYADSVSQGIKIPTQEQFVKMFKHNQVIKDTNEKVSEMVGEIRRISAKIEEAFPGLKNNKTEDWEQLKTYQKFLKDADDLEKAINERNQDMDAIVMLLFVRLQKPGLAERAKKAMDKVSARDFSGVTDFQKHLEQLEKMRNRVPEYYHNQTAQNEAMEYFEQAEREWDSILTERDRVHEIMSQERKAQLEEEERKREEEEKERQRLEEEKEKERQRLEAEKAEKEKRQKEYNDKMQKYQQSFLKLKMQSQALLMIDQLTKGDLELMMKVSEECQKLVTSEDYSALAIYQDPGYAQFRTRVVQYAKGLEVKAKPRLTKDLQEVLDPQIQKIQTSDLMMKLMTHNYGKKNIDPIKLNAKELKQLARDRELIQKLKDSKENKLLMQMTDFGFDKLCNILLDNIKKSGAFPGGK